MNPFIASKRRIRPKGYKIGKTKQTGIERFKSYPNGSSLLLHILCNDCTTKENQIKELFKNKYYPATLYGSEYFIGNYYEMILDIIKITTIDKTFCNSFNSKTFIELHKKLNNIPDNVNQQIDIKETTLTVNTETEVVKLNYFCDKCDLKYQTLCGLKKHMKTKHQNIETKKYKCNYCDTEFRYRQSKWLHEQKCKNINNVTLANQVKNLTAKTKELKVNSISTVNIDV
jgi:hypothetical protein